MEIFIQFLGQFSKNILDGNLGNLINLKQIEVNEQFRQKSFPYFLTASILYLPLIFCLKTMMNFISNDRKIQLRNILNIPFTIWNFSLAAFSICGTYVLGKHYLFNKYDCSILEPPTVIWINLFLVSKIPELMDTIFIILRGRSLIFLQWYHHLATMIL